MKLRRKPKEKTTGTQYTTGRHKSREPNRVSRHLHNSAGSSEVNLKLNKQQVTGFDTAVKWLAEHCPDFTKREWYDFFFRLRPYADPQAQGLNIHLTTEQYRTGFTDAVRCAAETFDCRPTHESETHCLSVVEQYVVILDDRTRDAREHLDAEGKLPAGAHLALSAILDDLSPIIENYG